MFFEYYLRRRCQGLGTRSCTPVLFPGTGKFDQIPLAPAPPIRKDVAQIAMP